MPPLPAPHTAGLRALLTGLTLALAGCTPEPPPPPASRADAASAPAAAGQVRRLNAVPAGVELRGKLTAAYGWTDSAGEQVLVLAEQRESRGADGTQNAALYAAQYTLGQDRPRRLWMLSDGVTRCEFDASAAFDLEAVGFPDLNQDGALETVVGYRSACASDVSPNDYKLILHAGKAKYGLRGLDRQGVRWLDPDSGHLTGLPLPDDCSPQGQRALQAKGWERDFEPPYLPGCYVDENDFAAAPPAFVRFMRQHWFARMRQQEESWLKQQQQE
ncbi:hypothetical protein JW897_14435 [Chromobacterium alkanivorans]|uniref:M949_RS01915 family surface polysaccharide biosynthesis protein n=1 Tax=Chromobacterium alkanivorans TaxID=1071719 RepID=UPI00196772C6|nr:hypothetical protein [Chromobacterium alkanivorans]MBN3004942.1 hypothetical protein [Chromobacterium alkanivorans]